MEFTYLLTVLFILIPVFSRYRLVRLDADVSQQAMDEIEDDEEDKWDSRFVRRHVIHVDASDDSEDEDYAAYKRQAAMDRINQMYERCMGKMDTMFDQLFTDDEFFATLKYQMGALYFLDQSSRIVNKEACVQLVVILTQSIKKNPYKAYAYSNRGHALMRMGMYKLALQDFSKAISLSPNESFFYYNRGFAWLALEERGMAYFDWLQASQMGNEPASRMMEEW